MYDITMSCMLWTDPYVMSDSSVFLLAHEKLQTFSQFYHFYYNNDNNFPYISI